MKMILMSQEVLNEIHNQANQGSSQMLPGPQRNALKELAQAAAVVGSFLAVNELTRALEEGEQSQKKEVTSGD